MLYKTVRLSDRKKKIKVQRLGLFDLDNVVIDVLGPFTYEIELVSGKTMLAEYDGSRWPEPPEQPSTPRHELEEESETWYEYREWALYQSWLVHERERKASIEAYHYRIADYILLNCVAEDDRRRIANGADWQKVYRAAVCPEVSSDHLAIALRQTFQSAV